MTWQEAVEEAIAATRATGERATQTDDEGGEAYAYPLSGGRIAWGYNDPVTGWCTARGTRE